MRILRIIWFSVRGVRNYAFFEVPVKIEVNGVMEHCPEYTCILYKPGQRVHYYAASGELIYNWIRFNCNEALYTEYFLPYGIPIVCPDFGCCYVTYWQMVANRNYWQYNSSSYVNEQLMHIIFHRLHDYAMSSDPFVYRDVFIKLRNLIYQCQKKPGLLKNGFHCKSEHPLLQKFYKEFFIPHVLTK